MEHEEQDFVYLGLCLIALHGIEKSADSHINATVGVV